MPILITRPGKYALFIHSPVMPAAGTLGFAMEYQQLLPLERLGAFVTNPITYQAWSPAGGTRVVPLDAGMLMHSGLPNPGVKRVIEKYRSNWAAYPVPVIAHLAGTTTDHVRHAARHLGEVDSIQAIELGLPDDISAEDAAHLFNSLRSSYEKPIIVRLPASETLAIAQSVADAGADALVVAAPPRGIARDPHSGRLVRGRVYGPLVKPMMMQLLDQLCQRLTDMPIIGAGGIHSPQDARDYLELGAVAVQIDSVTWVQPNLMARIARDLSSGLRTRGSDAYPDEWHADMSESLEDDIDFAALFSDDDEQSSTNV